MENDVTNQEKSRGIFLKRKNDMIEIPWIVSRVNSQAWNSKKKKKSD